MNGVIFMERPLMGKAILVGAGPGHPGLISVRGQRELERADVVLYDRLIARELLGLVYPEAQLIFVGKRAGHHLKPQPEINQLLLKHVRAGKRVVRLKGGDSFIFSRGGEEILALTEAGLPFEVVPGLTSAIAALAFAGIPLTQKGVNSSFTILTGHEDPTKPHTMLNWATLARQEMLVLLMAVKKLSQICQSLLAAGKPANTPAAMISWGTTDHQKVLTGRLDDIVDRVAASRLPTPAIIVVGEGVALREQLAWHRPYGLADGFIGEEQETSVSTDPMPTVALVGAGPGAADLVTVRGLEKLRQADVILHDRLVNPQLLAETKAAATVINVGKSDRRDRYPQAEINRLLVAHGQTGKQVVRLKGGDPFVFGLGGDECLALCEAGIRYEIVPGLSSVTAVPGSLHIPLTHRGVNTSFTVLSGHRTPSDNAEQWNHIPEHTTLLVLMGLKKLPLIVAHLLENGRSPQTPIALIESGTTAEQKVVIGTLADIVAKSGGLRTPTLIVIGEVVALRERFAWAEQRVASAVETATATSSGQAVWGKAVR
ncbi:MAG: uroporphyrinogen-III C-methyltransferase [Chloroflexota bacterium]